MNKSKYFNIALPLIISVSIILGFYISNLLPETTKSILIESPRKTNKLSVVIDYIKNEYVDKVEMDELIEKSIPELLKNLDPHSVYIGAEEATLMMEELEGQFDGIGVQFNILRDTIFIVNVIRGGPSERARVFAGDRIIKIDGELVAGVGVTNSTVMSKLRGKKGSIVEIKVKRQGAKDLLPIKIERGHIPLKSVDAQIVLDNNTGYIKINNFSRNTYNEFVRAVETLNQQTEIENIILDLRNNAGGFLSAATSIADEFLNNNKLIVYTEGNARPKQKFMSSRGRNLCVDYNVAVLIDEFSASASEIISGAIQDNDRGFIIGRRSYGKGLVQEAISFNDGSMMRLTTSRYYTPSGRSIQRQYDDGNEEYFMDTYRRYEHGELIEKDSIRLNDSLIYHTKGGRKVYGGGGIMPDVFVPVDTSGYSMLFREIRVFSHDYFFALDFVDKNRSQLRYINEFDELIHYLDSNDVMSDFYKYITDKNVTISEKDLLSSEKHIINSVYAHIARQVLGDNDFYRLFIKYDNTVEVAMKILKNKTSVFDL